MSGHAANGAKPRRTFALRVPPALMRLGARQIGRHVLNPSLTWDVQRKRLDRLTGASALPKGTTVVERTLNGVRADVLTVGTARPTSTVVHFHGGGYCLGSARMARAWAAHVSARAGCQVVMPEYRLAPEHAHPAALDDADAVMAALSGEVAPASIRGVRRLGGCRPHAVAHAGHARGRPGTSRRVHTPVAVARSRK